MPIIPRDFNTIVTSLRENITTNIPTFDTSEGTINRLALIDPHSKNYEYLESLLLLVQASQYLLTAKGIDLDLKALDYNVTRRGAQSASGFVQIYIARVDLTTPITIPENTKITSTGNIVYTTIDNSILNGFNAQQTIRNDIEVYEITAPVVCTVVGTNGNSLSNTLTTIELTELSVTNDAAITGGYDSEPDDSLAARCIQSFGIWSRGVVDAVEFGAKLVPGVFFAKASSDYFGHFNIFVSNVAGNLPDDMRTQVDVILQDWVAAGIGWSVLPPPLYLLNTTFKVVFISNSNLSAQQAQFRGDVATIINQNQTSVLYLNAFISDIQSAVKSYVQSFDLDTPNEHVVQTQGTIIRSGTITVIDNTV